MEGSSKRITVVLDDETVELLNELKKDFNENQSELIREALNFFYENKQTIEEYGENRIKFYTKMLSKGEHIILDVDHWTLFLEYLSKLPKNSDFWEELPKVAKSHADQLKHSISNPEEYLERIEACNFFSFQKTSENEFTLILNSKESSEFVKKLVKTTLTEMGYEIEINEDISKLRLKVK